MMDGMVKKEGGARISGAGSKSRFWMSFALASVLTLWSTTTWAANHDLDDATPFPNASSIPPLLGGDVIISTTGGTVANQPDRVTLPAGIVTVGGAGKGFSATIGAMEKLANNAQLNIVAATGAGDKAIKLLVNNLALNGTGNLTIDIGASASATDFNSLTIATLDNVNGEGVTSITVRENSNLTVSNMGAALGSNGAQFDLLLERGNAVFGTSTTLENGEIGAISGGYSNLLVGGQGLTLDGDLLSGTAAVLSAKNGSTLNVIKDWSGTYADVTTGVNLYGGVLDIQDDSTINVGNLTFNSTTGFATTNSGTLNVHGNLKINATFSDAPDVDTIVVGTTTITAAGTYQVDGVGNNYQGDMIVEGLLENRGIGPDTVIRMGLYDVGGAAVRKGNILVNGGSISAVGMGDFKIDNANILVTAPAAAGAATLKANNTGMLDLSTSDLTINLTAPAGEVFMEANSDIVVNSYSQLAGNAKIGHVGAAGTFTVNGAAVIGGEAATRETALAVEGVDVRFTKGLTLERYGALTTATGGRIHLGDAAGNGDLVMNGDNKLYAAAGSTLALRSPGGTGRMLVSDKGNVAYGEIDATELDVTVNTLGQLTVATDADPTLAGTTGLHVKSMTVNGDLLLGTAAYPGGGVEPGVVTTDGAFRIQSGGRVKADHETAYIHGAAGNRLVVADGGNLIADTAIVATTGFDSVEINGTFTAGILDGLSRVARLQADSDVNIGSTGLVALTTELASKAVAGDDETTATRLIETSSGAIASKTELGSISMLGTFGFALNNAATVLFIKSATGQVVLDGSEYDRNQAWWNLQGMWGKNQVEKDLADIIYDVVKGDTTSDGRPAGDKNVSIMDAIANPAGKVVGIDTLEYVNGAHLYGVTDVAIETTRTFMSDITNRAKALNCQFMAMRDDFGTLDALASTAMNSQYLNRMWFGGSGLKQDAAAQDGFSGYSYESYGLVGGYDRVVAPNLAMGASFAYNRGDYEDKGALRHDSEIESLSVGLYGTYSHCTGFFGTLFGAYTYSDNSIRELRRDPSINSPAWAVSDFRTNTWSLGALFGYDLRLGESLTITPSAGINYIQARNSDHESLLDGVVTQQVKDAKNRGVFLPVELTVQYDMCVGAEGKLRVEAIAGYAYNLRKSGMDGSIDFYGLDPASGISIHGRDNARHSYKLGGGVRYAVRNFDIGVHYDYIGRSDYDAHRVMGTVGLSF